MVATVSARAAVRPRVSHALPHRARGLRGRGTGDAGGRPRSLRRLPLRGANLGASDGVWWSACRAISAWPPHNRYVHLDDVTLGEEAERVEVAIKHKLRHTNHQGIARTRFRSQEGEFGMARCKWCDKRGIFLSVDPNGLCRDCQYLIEEIQSRARVLEQSMQLAEKGKTFGTRLSRCELVIEHAKYLVAFERKGVPTVSPSPSQILDEFRSHRTHLIVSEAEIVVEKAFEKSSLASTVNAKERALAAGVLKLREVTQGLKKHSLVKPMEDRLRQEIHRVNLDGYLDAARKAEFKGNIKKAIDQYQEALYFIRNDDIDDAQQQSSIREIEVKLEELSEK